LISKKYIYAKNVYPFGRKGELINVEVDPDFSDTITLYNDKDGNHFLDCKTDLIFISLIEQGIIKEFEPREVFVEYKRGENNIDYLNDVANNIEHYAHHKNNPIYNVVKFIKMIE